MAQEPMSGSHIEELDLFYEEVRKANSRPLWMMGGENLTTEPQPKTAAFIWKWTPKAEVQASRFVRLDFAAKPETSGGRAGDRDRCHA